MKWLNGFGWGFSNAGMFLLVVAFYMGDKHFILPAFSLGIVGILIQVISKKMDIDKVKVQLDGLKEN